MIYQYNRKISRDNLILAIFSIIFFIAIILFPSLLQTRYQPTTPLETFGIRGFTIFIIVLLLYYAYRQIKRYFSKKPGLELTDTGIYLNSTDQSFIGFIPWNDIYDIHLCVIRGSGIYYRIFSDPEIIQPSDIKKYVPSQIYIQLLTDEKPLPWYSLFLDTRTMIYPVNLIGCDTHQDALFQTILEFWNKQNKR